MFGVHLARIAAAHGVDVEEDIATIIPAEADADSDEPLPPLFPWLTCPLRAQGPICGSSGVVVGR